MDGRRLYETVAAAMPLSVAQPIAWAQLPLDTQAAWMAAAGSVTEEIIDDEGGCDCPAPPDELDGKDLFQIWAAGQTRKGLQPKEWGGLDEIDQWLWHNLAEEARA